MIEIIKKNNDFSVCAQVSIEDVAHIAKLGFKTIINNRPDSEGGDTQPLGADIQREAEKYGLAYFHIPVIPNHIQPYQVDAFKQAYMVAHKPVLGFCKTGNRAGRMLELAQL